MLVVYFFFIFPFLFNIIVGNIFYAPHSYVQVCTAAAVEDHCLVLSFGGLAVWLSSLLKLSLQCCGHLTAAWFWGLVDSLYGSVPCLRYPCAVVDTWQLLGSELWRTHCMAQFLACTVPVVSWTPDSCHLAWLIAAVACGLAPSSCASNLWVDRHSVPWACLSHPWVAYLWLDRCSCLWPVFLLPGLWYLT